MNVGIIWDLDGTLLDTLEDLADGTNYALSQLGYPQRTLEEIRQFVGNGARNLMIRAVPEGGDPDAVLDVFRPYYNEHCQIKTKPYDGILDVLAALKTRYPMAVVSNKPDSAVKPLCAQYFPGLYARGEIAGCPRKPAPDSVWAAMEAIGVDTCIYVGDSEVDVETARNAKVKCLSVLWGFRDRDVLEQAGAAYLCENTSELIEKLEEMVVLCNG